MQLKPAACWGVALAGILVFVNVSFMSRRFGCVQCLTLFVFFFLTFVCVACSQLQPAGFLGCCSRYHSGIQKCLVHVTPVCTCAVPHFVCLLLLGICLRCRQPTSACCFLGCCSRFHSGIQKCLVHVTPVCMCALPHFVCLLLLDASFSCILPTSASSRARVLSVCAVLLS